MSESVRQVHVIGAGPAGLMAAERLAQAGLGVVVHDRMPSVARKFLMAGRGGLNLTHSEPLGPFLKRYGPAEERLTPLIAAFSRDALTAWAEGLGQETFIGSSGRVFPKALKASPLLRAWLVKLADLGVIGQCTATSTTVATGNTTGDTTATSDTAPSSSTAASSTTVAAATTTTGG